ncbi:hypothetical protein [Pectobacterium sp. LFLA-215]|uniref:hypothetical protein n=1 Tax=Pectobacterium sp. LFLA-215 TaxID=3419008 RepID=UPI003F5C14DB
MSDKSMFKNIKGRIDFVQKEVDALSGNNLSFSEQLALDSIDSHLSELKAQQRELDSSHPLLDFLELRFKGSIVDLGTMPLELLGVISTNLAALVQRATHKISSGKDSQKVPYDIKSSLDLRLAGFSPGSTRLGVTFSTGVCELVDTVSSRAITEILNLLNSDDATSLINQVAEIGYNSTQNLKKIIEECDKNQINFDVAWIGPFSDGKKFVSVNTQKIKILNERLAATKITQPVTERIVGELASLSKYGKLELEVDGERIKASYPIDMLDEIQKSHKIGQKLSLVIEITDIHNDHLGLHRKNYLVKSLG